MLLTTALAVLALGAGPARAASSRLGTSGAQFLKIAPGARPSGMGEAFAGVSDDVYSIYYNPAGLGNLRRVEATGMHDSYFQDINYEFAALSVPMLAWVDTKEDKNAYGVLGAAVYDLSVSNIQRRTVNETDEPTGTFGANDFAYALSYAYAFPETGLSLGLTGKFIDQNLDSARATAFAADLGGLYRSGRLSLGAGARNAGSRSKFSSVADPLPLTVFSGAGFRFDEHWIGSLEVDLPRDNDAAVGFGAEYRQRFASRLTGCARAGYNTKNNAAGGLGGAAFGFGVGVGNLSFDFALVPFGDLGNTYKYSLTAKF